MRSGRRRSTRIWVIGFTGLVVILITAAVIIWQSFESGLERLERRAAEDQALDLHRALVAKLETLRVLCRDWSRWDDCYAFTQRSNDTFVAANVTSDLFRSSGICLVAILDRADAVRMAVGPGPTADAFGRGDADLTTFIRQQEHWLGACMAGTSVLEVVRTADDALLVAAEPVLRSDGGGAPAGMLVMVRQLDDHMQADLREVLGRAVDMRVAVTDLPQHPEGWNWLLDLPIPGSARALPVAEGLQIDCLLHAVDGRPGLVLTTVIDRPWPQVGRGAVGVALVVVVVAVVATVAFSLWWVRLGVQQSLDQIRQTVDRYAPLKAVAYPERQSRPSSSGHLTNLAMTVENTMAELADARVNLAKAKVTAERASEAKSAFLANLSHEIRTPLNGILGLGRMLANRSLDPQSRSYVDTLLESGESMLHMLNDVLDVARIEAGHIDVQPQPCDVIDLVRRCCAQFLGAAIDRGLGLSAAVASGCPDRQMIDPTRFRQVVGNLLGNAVKYTREGGITVRIDRSQTTIDIVVADTGIGIPEDVQDRLFDAFDRGLAEGTGDVGGSGLGLALSQRLAEAMGGGIALRSTPGQGSTFIFSLPLSSDISLESSEPAALAEIDRILLLGDPDCIDSAGVLPYPVDEIATLDDLQQRYAVAVDAEQVVLVVIDADRSDSQTEAIKAWLGANPRRPPVLVIAPPRPRHAWLHGFPTAGCAILARPASPQRIIEVGVGICADLINRRQLAAGRRFRRGQRVLVADDSPINRMVAIGMLDGLGIDTMQASNGREAVMQAFAEWPDAILMDLRMPVLGGIEATREIIAGLQDRQLPVIGMTADVAPDRLAAARAAGMVAVVAKPIDPEELIELLANHLGIESGRPSRPPSTKLIPRDGGIDGRLESLLGDLDVDDLRVLIAASLEELEERMEALDRQFDDLPALSDTAHAIKGLLGNLGLSGPSELAARVMRAADAGALADLPSLIARLHGAIEAIPGTVHAALDRVIAES